MPDPNDCIHCNTSLENVDLHSSVCLIGVAEKAAIDETEAHAKWTSDLVLTEEEQTYSDNRKRQVRTLIEVDKALRAHLGIEVKSVSSKDLSEKHLKDDTSERVVDLNRLNKLAESTGGKFTFTLCNAAGEELDLKSLYLK